MRRSLFILALLLLCAAGAGVGHADPPPNRTVNYEIRRNGGRIGTHRVVFERRPDAEGRFTVHHRIQIRVTVLSFEAYTYTMDSRETWQGHRLLGITASTDRNGEPLTVLARVSGQRLRMRTPNGRTEIPSHAVPSSPQHYVFDRPITVMFEAEDGRALDVRVSQAATENLTLGGRSVPCRRVRVRGDLDATLWYAPSGILVKKRLTAPDGSTILTVLQ